MTEYGIKLVSAGWNNDAVIGFSDRGYSRWGADIVAGTRMLLYETATPPPGSTFKGTKSIVGEVEVTRTFKDGEQYRTPTEHHDQLVPVKVLRSRRAEKSVSLSRVRELIGDESWPRRGEAWKSLPQEVYEQLCAELEK